MKFYEGRKIEVRTTCENCGKELVWYYLFPQSINNSRYETFIFTEGENVLSANLNILKERENEIDVNINFYCRLCGYVYEYAGTIYKKDDELMFREQI